MPSELTPQSQVETPAQKGFSVLALVSTLTGALSYLLIFLHSLVHMRFLVALILAPISALAAIITGHRSHYQIKHSNGELSGIKLARAGLIMGYLYYAICIIALVLVILGASWVIKALGIQ
jgi:hypothetical protein